MYKNSAPSVELSANNLRSKLSASAIQVPCQKTELEFDPSAIMHVVSLHRICDIVEVFYGQELHRRRPMYEF